MLHRRWGIFYFGSDESLLLERPEYKMAGCASASILAAGFPLGGS